MHMSEGIYSCTAAPIMVLVVDVAICMKCQPLFSWKNKKHNRLLLSRSPRDSLNVFEIFLSQHIRFVELRKK